MFTVVFYNFVGTVIFEFVEFILVVFVLVLVLFSGVGAVVEKMGGGVEATGIIIVGGIGV